MEEMNSKQVDKAFWYIVVNTAARNEEIKTIVESISINDLKDLSIADAMYHRMGELLLETYGIPDNLQSEVFNQCENNMIDRMVDYGKA